MGLGDGQVLKTEVPRRTWAIGGGKGGVGKSLIGICLAYWLGRLKGRVVLVDADLGGANLHTMLGIRVPSASLEDFLLRKVGSLEEILLETALPNVRLLAGGSEIPSLANPNYAQKTRLARALDRLSAEHILVDLGAGTALTTLDFFLACPHRIVVLTPQPTSIENAYGFIKAALYRKLASILRPTALKGLLDSGSDSQEHPFPRSTDEVLEEVALGAPAVLPAVQLAVTEFRVLLVVNQIRRQREEQVAEVLRKVAGRYLGTETRVLGCVPFDPAFERWAARMDFGGFGRERGDGALAATYQIAYAMLQESDAPRMAA